MDNIEEKQQFLRKNILDKGYNGEEFMIYLKSKNNDKDIDLNNWNLDQLKIVVNEFISNHDSNNNQIDINEYNDIIYPHTIKIGEINNHEIFANNNYYNKYIYNNNEKVTCKTNDITIISKLTKIKIIFGSPLIIDSGFFSRKYIAYQIKTIPFNINVKRRYGDFQWLRNVMLNLYPNTVVPPIPKKNIFPNYNDSFISKRIRLLNKFINGISIHPLLKNSQIFLDFLIIDDEKRFNNKKNEYNKIQSPQYLKDYKTSSGEIDISLDENKEKLLSNMKESCLNYKSSLINIIKEYKELISLINNTSKQMKIISDLWLEFGKTCEKYNENQDSINSYLALNKLMLNWSEIEKNKITFFNNQIKEHFRYIKNEYISFEDLINKVETTKNDFYKEKDNLMSKKNKLFEEGKILNWELEEYPNAELLINDKEFAFSKMLPKETKTVLGYRNFYAFYLNSAISEFNRLRELNEKRTKKNVKTFFQDIIKDLCFFNSNLFEITDFYLQIDEKVYSEDNEDKEIISEYNNILKKEKENQFKKPDNF